MKWFKRALWLAAWAFWACLGYGLYRELPRRLGPPIAHLPISDDDRLLGFVGDSRLVAVQLPNLDQDGVPRLRLFDALTGRDMGERPMPFASGAFAETHHPLFQQFREPLRYGVLFGAKTGGITPQSYSALDVLSGRMIALTDRPVASATLHPHKPWVALVEGVPPKPMERVSVVDLHSGRALLRQVLSPDRTSSSEPFFLLHRDAIVLPRAVHAGDEAGWRVDLDVLAIGASAPLSEIVSIADHPFAVESAARNGRIAYAGSRERIGDRTAWKDVYDFHERRFLSSIPKDERTVNGTELARHAETVLSPSGRATLSYGPEWTIERGGAVMSIARGTLLDLDRDEVLWRARPSEIVDAVWGDLFVVKEQWQELWKNWFPHWEFETLACRSLETGRLVVRLTEDVDLDPRRCDAARSLIAFSEGAVHRFELFTNWSLLALCQSILALPLFLLWAALRWRRKRRMKLAGQQRLG